MTMIILSILEVIALFLIALAGFRCASALLRQRVELADMEYNQRRLLDLLRDRLQAKHD